MIIGFDGSRAFSDKRTGTENYSYQLLKVLAKIDKKNRYIVYLRAFSRHAELVSASSKRGRSRNEFGMTNNPEDSKKEEWPDNFQFKVLNWPKLWTQAGLALQTFKDKLDVLFVPAHTLPVIRKPGLKTVVTVHDLGSEFLPQMHQLKQRLYLGLMQKFQLKTATKIIAVSNATKKDLIKKIGVDEKKIDVVYEGFDNYLYKKLSNDTIINSLRQYNLRQQEYFLFVGTVQPRKNLERVMEAFSRVIFSSVIPAQAGIQKTEKSHGSRVKSGMTKTWDDKLVIVGHKGWLSDEIYALPKKLGIVDRVKFLGYVPDEDLPALYSGAIAFVYPSLFEGFGLPILEAQVCGCPVITSNISSMPEVAGSGVPQGYFSLHPKGTSHFVTARDGAPQGHFSLRDGAIFVDPYSVDDIVIGMERVKGKADRVKLIKAGFENVKRFSWEKCAKETLEVIMSS